MIPRVSVIVTVYNEGQSIVGCLDRIMESVKLPCEILVVYDRPDDTTAVWAQNYGREDDRIIPTLNTFGPGPAFAIRYGFSVARAPVVVVTMADGCDDPAQIDDLVRLVERGVVIAAASRYSRGGQQVGGSLLKKTMSRTAGLSLAWFARVGTRDATNSFKAYDRTFVKDVGIDSDAGFEVGLELVAKARRLRLPVAELPTIWLNRTYGSSNFKARSWLPRYLYWYRFAFGRKMRLEDVRTRQARSCS